MKTTTTIRAALCATTLTSGAALAALLPPGFMPVTEGYQYRPLDQRNQGVRPQPIQAPLLATPGNPGGYGYPGLGNGLAPGWPGGMPGQGYGGPPMQRGAMPYGQPARASAPTLEADLSAGEAYAQENLIYTLRITSDQNLSRVDPVLPSTNDLVFQKIDGPITRTQQANGRQQIVSEFHYAATPVRPGKITLEPARATGELARGGTSYDVRTAAPIELSVKPADPGMQPWLPLEELSIQSRFKNADSAEAGQPLSLTIEMKAVGATGAQLPSLEKQLASPDFRIYQEKSETHGILSPDGRHLEGTRVESFTLVPQHNGLIQIPSLRVNWWNVTTDRAETLVLPIRQIAANGGLRGEGAFGATPTSTFFPAGSPLAFWLPLLGVAFMLGTYWSWIWARRKGIARRAAGEISSVLGLKETRLVRFLAAHSGQRYLHLVRQVAIRTLPSSVRLWYCVRYVNSETNPRDWCQMFKFLAHKHMGISPQLALPAFGKQLIATHPKADAQAMTELMVELDSVMYGSETMDFEAWKHAFRQQLRPRLLPAGFRRRLLHRPANKLPELNPRTI